MKRNLLKTIVCACLLSVAMPLMAQTAAKPFVIPELKTWTAASGSFAMPASVSIRTAKGEDVGRVGGLLAADLREMFGQESRLVADGRRGGDIVLALKADRLLGPEGYELRIGRDQVVLTAPTAKGLFWATRTLLQMLDQTQGKRLPCGSTRDWPDYAIRGAMLDAGRKYLPMPMLRDYVRVMAYYKMNMLQVHLNDNGFPLYFDDNWDKTQAAFRLESNLFPGLTARDGFYTKQSFTALQLLGDSLGVDVVPEIDVPAHSLAFSRFRPSIASNDYGADHLDLGNPATYAFLDSLFGEYLGGEDPVFKGRYVHIGTDEYSNKTQQLVEQFRGFTDHYIKLVEQYGKKAVIWGSQTHARGATPIKVKDVLMCAWSNDYSRPDSMMALGYDLISIPDREVYIVPKAGYYHDYLDCRWLYENWTPAVINGNKFPERHPQIKGGMFAVWNDVVGNGISTRDIHYRAMPAIRTLATKMWTGSGVSMRWDEYAHRAQGVREAPGVNYAGWHAPGVVLEKAVVRPGDTLDADQIGWNYDVSFDITARKEQLATPLFHYDDATFWLSDPASGLLGFSRDGYLYNFNYQFVPGERAHVRIHGDRERTQLYVDGRLVESLDVRKIPFKRPMYYISTLVFPLKEAGGSFKSVITNLKVVSL